MLVAYELITLGFSADPYLDSPVEVTFSGEHGKE